MNQICPNCKHKSLRFRTSTKDYKCSHYGCESVFDKNMKEPRVKNAIKDDCGNYYNVSYSTEEGIIKQTHTYYLEPDKTTLRGSHSKFKEDTNCKFPERLDCNGRIGYNRCEFMKYERDGSGFSGLGGFWRCLYDQ